MCESCILGVFLQKGFWCEMTGRYVGASESRCHVVFGLLRRSVCEFLVRAF